LDEVSEKRLCESCRKKEAKISAVVDGVYKQLCYSCRPKPQVNSGHARWSRSLDLEDHEWEIQQPYNSDGSINPRFAKLYPEQAKRLFTEEQLRKAQL
jgi:hypothetical protein